MQKYLLPVLKKHKNVAVYGCGHIHNFQYIRKPDTDIAFWVNSAAALSRKVSPTDGTQWCNPSTGFTVIAGFQEKSFAICSGQRREDSVYVDEEQIAICQENTCDFNTSEQSLL